MEEIRDRKCVSEEPFCIYKDGQNDGVAARFSYYPKEDISVTILSNQDCDMWDMTSRYRRRYTLHRGSEWHKVTKKCNQKNET